MTVNDLREKLALLLDKLKRNKAAVPLTELRTKYRKGYLKLCQNISTVAALYVIQTAFCGLRIRKELAAEATLLIHQAILEAGIRQKLSATVFGHCDMAELDSLLSELRTLSLAALESLYARHIGFFLTDRCLEDPPKQPFFYNDANGQVFDGRKWLPLEAIPR